jgi:hypothetical protein
LLADAEPREVDYSDRASGLIADEAVSAKSCSFGRSAGEGGGRRQK